MIDLPLKDKKTALYDNFFATRFHFNIACKDGAFMVDSNVVKRPILKKKFYDIDNRCGRRLTSHGLSHTLWSTNPM
jgi:hypothetical protein